MPDGDASLAGARHPTQIGSYRLVEPLGSGGMSSVFRAIHDQTGLEVAIKVLPRSLAKNSTLLQRFLREAKSAELLEDAHIVAIYDRGSEAGRYYLVLEYVAGGDLHDRVRLRGPLPVEEAVRIIREVATGLRHAAQRGLIHRDIKPANILLTADDRVKITDLGLALQIDEEDERVTRDGTTVGTVDYMAPEQARDSRATSVRSDIYSLGCTLYFLLTGQPPFPGGDVTDKLRRHAQEAPPDVRITRPDVPVAISAALRKMMAKKPEGRYANYDALLAALEFRPDEAPLEALIDDEDDAPAPLEALVDDEDEAPQPLQALIDDEDERGYSLGPGTPSGPSPASTVEALPPVGSTKPTSSRPTGKRHAEVNLSDLAALDDAEPPRHARRPPDVPKPTPNYPTPRAADLLDIEDSLPSAGFPAVRRGGYADLPLKAVIIRGIGLGLAIVVVGYLAYFLITFDWSSRPAPVQGDGDAELGSPVDGAGSGSVVGPIAAKSKAETPSKSVGPVWVEPADADPEPAPEPDLPADLLAALGLGGIGAPARGENPVRHVRRVEAARDKAHVPSLRLALDTIGGTIEIDDSGPFFESDLRASGRNLLIRAGRGARPIVVVERPSLPSAREAPAAMVLNDARVVIEGVHFVIRGSDLLPNHAALFLCRGASLTLRDCSFTVVGAVEHPYAIVQVGEAAQPRAQAPSAVRLERVLVRGLAVSAVRLADGPAEVHAFGSALLSGSAPAIALSGGPKLARELRLVRSVVAAQGPAIELAGSIAGPDATPPTIRALDCAFGHVEGAGAAPFVALRDEAGGGPGERPAIDWRGERNRFTGWTNWLAGGAGRRPRLRNLGEARSAWSGSDRQSVEAFASWPAGLARGLPSSAELRSVVPDLAASLARVANPGPFLAEKTVGQFARLAAEPGPNSSPSGADSAVDLDFDASAPPWSGDLGRFLAEKAPAGARRLRVRARGSGRVFMTPFAPPEGVGLDLRADPPRAGSEALSFAPSPGSTAAALIHVRGANLAISGVRFARDATANPGYLLRVDHGNLALERCWLTAPGGVETGGGGLVAFRTEGTRLLANRPPEARPACSLTDCLLLTGGEALAVDAGRAVVTLTGCAVAAGEAGFVLRPERVRRASFEADFILDRCTVAAERDLFRLGSWPGLAPGPDRPWVVHARACVFSDQFERRTPSSAVLVRAEPSGLAAGALFWQSRGDVYDVAHFTAGGEAPPAPGRDDLIRQWLDLWGRSHIISPTGAGASVRFRVGKLRPGDVAPGDLALEPADARTKGTPAVGADLGRLGIEPIAGAGQPRRK